MVSIQKRHGKVHRIDWNTIAPNLLSKERELREDPSAALEAIGVRGTYVIADLGCGPGYYARKLAHRAIKLYCVDSNSAMLDLARKTVKSNRAVFLLEDAGHTSIPSASVDIAFMANSLHDFDRNAVRKEVLRILKPAGRIIAIDWRKGATQGGPPQRIRMSEDDYLSLFSGFSIYKRFDPGQDHFGIVIRRCPAGSR